MRTRRSSLTLAEESHMAVPLLAAGRVLVVDAGEHLGFALERLGRPARTGAAIDH